MVAIASAFLVVTHQTSPIGAILSPAAAALVVILGIGFLSYLGGGLG